MSVGSSGSNTIAVGSTGKGVGIFSTQGNRVKYSSDMSVWVLVGQGTNTIAYSLNNGATFTGLGISIFTTAGLGIAVKSS
jgi:hypothetical protein